MREVCTEKTPNVVTFRPLAMATAWAGFHASGGSVAPQQAFNFAIAAVAWLVVLSAVREHRAFGVLAMLGTGLYFSGYIYLFHLHGVFYSPLLLFVAVLVATSLRRRKLTSTAMLYWLAVAGFVSLYHSFAWLVFAAFIAGTMLEQRSDLQRGQLAAGIASILTAAVVLFLLAPGRGLPPLRAVIKGGLATYRILEVHQALSIVTVTLTLFTVASIPTRNRSARTLWGMGAAALCGLMFRAGLPLIPAWLAACLLKSAWSGYWRLAGLLGVTAVLPLLFPSGTPTYGVFVLLVACAVLASDWTWAEQALTRLRVPWRLAPALCAALLLVILRAGVHVPVVSEVVQPIMAEREKTFQLRSLVEQLLESPYADRDIVFTGSVDDPVRSANALDRRHRPPTYEGYVNEYLQWRRRASSVAGSGRHVSVSFGEAHAGEAVLQADGRYNGSAVARLARPGP